MSKTIILKDQLNSELLFSNTPKRIISLVPSQTELLCDMGLENNIVGLTKFCVHPVDIKEGKTIVGGTKNIKIEKIKALKPDVILCNKEENTKEIVEACRDVCIVHVSDIETIDDALEMITQYGVLFNKEVEASEISYQIQSNLKDFKTFIKNKPVVKTAYFIWRNPWMVAGNNTFINHLLELNNFKNVFGNQERYPEIELEKMGSDQNPELVLLSSEPYPFNDSHILEINKVLDNTKTLLVDGELFSWYGSRLVKSFEYFKNLRDKL